MAGGAIAGPIRGWVGRLLLLLLLAMPAAARQPPAAVTGVAAAAPDPAAAFVAAAEAHRGSQRRLAAMRGLPPPPPPPPTIAEVAAYLGAPGYAPGTALLLYHFDGGRLLSWLIDDHGLSAFATVAASEADVATANADLRLSLGVEAVALTRAPRLRDAPPPDYPGRHEIEADARRLAALLLPPALQGPLQRTRHLIVLGSGSIATIPFAMLPIGGGRTLIDIADITFAPGLSDLSRPMAPWNGALLRVAPLIVGSGRNEMAFASLTMLRRLLLDHQKVIFVPSEISDPAVVTISNALQPLQYAVLRNTTDIIEGYIVGSSYERPHYKASGLYQAVRAFQADVGSKIVLGVYRASALCPGRVFYAHEDHVHSAAQVVMADSALQEARGFPNLIDIADRTCRGMFEPGGLKAQVHAALARGGSPFRFLDERGTRP